MNNKMILTAFVATTVLAVTTVTAPSTGVAAERTVKLAGWGAKSGPLRSFGVNSEAVLNAAIKAVNDAGLMYYAVGRGRQLTNGDTRAP